MKGIVLTVFFLICCIKASAATVVLPRQVAIAWVAGHYSSASKLVEEEAKISWEYVMDGYDDIQPIRYKFEFNNQLCAVTVEREKLDVLDGHCKPLK